LKAISLSVPAHSRWQQLRAKTRLDPSSSRAGRSTSLGQSFGTRPCTVPLLDLNRLLEVLTRNEVDVVVVGGSAAGFLETSRFTVDAECVVRREPASSGKGCGSRKSKYTLPWRQLS
jgi:hypothetical protein